MIDFGLEIKSSQDFLIGEYDRPDVSELTALISDHISTQGFHHDLLSSIILQSCREPPTHHFTNFTKLVLITCKVYAITKPITIFYH